MKTAESWNWRPPSRQAVSRLVVWASCCLEASSTWAEAMRVPHGLTMPCCSSPASRAGLQGRAALCARLRGGMAKEADAARLDPRLKTPGCSCCAPPACCACHLYGMKPCPGGFARLCPAAAGGSRSTPPAPGADAKLLLRPCAYAPTVHHMLRPHPKASGMDVAMRNKLASAAAMRSDISLFAGRAEPVLKVAT